MRIGIKLPYAATYYHYSLSALFETFEHIDLKDWLFFHLLHLLPVRDSCSISRHLQLYANETPLLIDIAHTVTEINFFM